MNKIKLLIGVVLLGLMFSCGEDFTDDYNKLKKEYDEVTAEKEKINKINEELKGRNLELVKKTQSYSIKHFVRNVIRLSNVVNLNTKDKVTNVFQDGQLSKTIVIKYNRRIDFLKEELPVETIEFIHTHNDDGVITKSESMKMTINWGWENENCLQFIITNKEKNESITYSLNQSGLYTNIKGDNTENKFKYNTNNDIVERITINNFDKVYTYKTTYEYYTDNTLKLVKYYKNDVLRNKIELKTDNELYIVKKTNYKNNSDELYEVKEQKYDKNDNLIFKEIFYYRDGFILNYINNIKYNGKVITEQSSTNIKSDYDGNIITKSKTDISNITRFKDSEEVDSYEDALQVYEGRYKKCKVKRWIFSEGSFNLDSNYEVERFDGEKHRNILNILYFDENNNKTIEYNYSNFFDSQPYAAKQRLVKTYENNVLTKTTTEVNEVNNNYSQVWKVKE